MSELERTPGPWSVNTDPRYEGGRPAMVWGPKGPGWGVVCDLPAHYPREFNEADARLIAAAPEMYAELVRLRDFLRSRKLAPQLWCEADAIDAVLDKVASS